MDRRWVSRRALGLHATLAVIVPGFLALTAWQVDRAVTGNTLSWVYSFEWPFFAGYAVYLWWRLVHEDPSPSAAGVTEPRGAPGPDGLGVDGGAAWPQGRSGSPVAGPARAAAAATPPGAGAGTGRDVPDGEGARDDADEELEAYNRYLAALNESGKRKRW